jgi:phage-related tail fiber protein
MTMRVTLLCAAALAAFSVPAAAADLVHDYEFNGNAVTDSVGGVDGDGDYAQLDSAIFPYAPSNDFSLYIAFTGHSPQYNYTELVSQDGGSFYLGQDPGGNIRIGDGALSVPVAFPTGTGAHGMLLTSSASGSHLYIDGSLVWSGGGYTSSYPNPGSITRFGRQYGPYGEYFQGDIDAIRLFIGTAAYAEASGSVGVVPEPPSWAMMLAGFGLAGATLRSNRRNRAFA